MSNFFKWVKDNIATLLLILVVIIAAKYIINTIEITRTPIIYPQTGGGNPYYSQYIRESSMQTTLTTDKSGVNVKPVVVLTELPKDGRVFLLYRPEKKISPDSQNYKQGINDEKYTEVELNNISGLIYSKEFTLPYGKNYDVEILIRGSEKTVSSYIEKIYTEEIAKQAEPLKIRGRIEGYSDGQYSYNISVNTNYRYPGDELKDLRATISYKGEELFTINLLDKRYIRRADGNGKEYGYDGLDRVKGVSGAIESKELKLILRGKTNDGTEIYKEFIGENN